jgi:hypothetical protein
MDSGPSAGRLRYQSRRLQRDFHFELLVGGQGINGRAAGTDRHTHECQSGLDPACLSGSRRVDACFMADVSQILNAIEQGDARAAEELLPLVYDELRRLAAQRLAHEKPGQTLNATALVHEAYLRLVASEDASAPGKPQWNSRGHFCAAAAEAMRRILVENVPSEGGAN